MVKFLLEKSPPTTEAALFERCRMIEGLSFAQLAYSLGISIPLDTNHRKGWLGQAIELALGSDAQNKSEPDFRALSIELKTLPLDAYGNPSESTFITSIPLLNIHKQTWKTSQCYAKLKRVLWIPIEGDKLIPYAQRRIGQAFLWAPDKDQEAVLAADWEYLSLQISTGHLESLDARSGEYLQVRPKAANAKSLCYGYDFQGNKVQTLPRGFYLRSGFTSKILKSYSPT